MANFPQNNNTIWKVILKNYNKMIKLFGGQGKQPTESNQAQILFRKFLGLVLKNNEHQIRKQAFCIKSIIYFICLHSSGAQKLQIVKWIFNKKQPFLTFLRGQNLIL